MSADPFGHSATQASLLSAEVGFDSLWFLRIDLQDRANRIAKKEMQFIWRSSPSLGPTAQARLKSYRVGFPVVP